MAIASSVTVPSAARLLLWVGSSAQPVQNTCPVMNNASNPATNSARGCAVRAVAGEWRATARPRRGRRKGRRPRQPARTEPSPRGQSEVGAGMRALASCSVSCLAKSRESATVRHLELRSLAAVSARAVFSGWSESSRRRLGRTLPQLAPRWALNSEQPYSEPLIESALRC